jgi:hypothetical protein
LSTIGEGKTGKALLPWLEHEETLRVKNFGLGKKLTVIAKREIATPCGLAMTFLFVIARSISTEAISKVSGFLLPQE